MALKQSEPTAGVTVMMQATIMLGTTIKFLKNIRTKKRILGDGFWVIIGQVLTAIAALVSVRIMTEVLQPEDFGLLTLLVGIAALALGLAVGPYLQAVIRLYADWARDGDIATLRMVSARRIRLFVLVTSGILGCGGLFVGPWFELDISVGWLIATLFVIDSARSFEIVLLNAARRQRPTAVWYAADAWARPFVAVAAILMFGASAHIALLGYIIGSALVFLVLRFIVQREGAKPALRVSDIDEGKQLRLQNELWRYALPLTPLAIFGWISGIGDRYLISGMLGLAEVGLYAAAYGLVSRPFLMLGAIVELTMRPVLNDAVAVGDQKRIDQVKRGWLLAAGLGSIAGVILFFLLKDMVAYLLLAERYRSSVNLIPWIALGHSIKLISDVFSRFCYSYNDTKAVLLLTIIGSLVAVVVMIPAILNYGLLGAAMAVPVYFGVESILAYFLSNKAARAYNKGRLILKEECA